MLSGFELYPRWVPLSCVGFVSHMFFHCHEMRLHCFLLLVAWFQLALISSDCFESFFQSVKYSSIVCRRKFHGKRFKFETFHQIMSSSSMAWWLCEVGSTRRHRVQILLTTFFFPSSFSFLFCFVLFAYLFCCFFLLFVFKYIPK